MSAIRVLLVDDHALFRKGVAELLASERDFRLVGEAGDGAQALEMARDLMPDVVLMDLSMPVMDGLEATRRIKAELPCVRIVVVTAGADASVLEAVRSGAQGFVPKDADPAALLCTLRAVARRGASISRAMAAQLLTGLDVDPPSTSPSLPGAGLAPRERETLRLTARGKSPAAIASTLGTAEDTVASLLRNILEKLRTQAPATRSHVHDAELAPSRLTPRSRSSPRRPSRPSSRGSYRR